MTAIITKQNAKDKAFIGGGGGGGGDDYPKDATFDSIEAQTITCDTITVNKEATFTVNDSPVTFINHETRILTLEQAKPIYPTDATFNNITVNKKANFKIDDKTISFANHESRILTLEQSGGGGGGDSLFTSYSGHDYFHITNNVLKTGSTTIEFQEPDGTTSSKNYYY